LLTSLYCVLAFVPYTYYAFIKAPAYEWMPWFVRNQAILYWVVLAGVVLAHRRRVFRSSPLAVFGSLIAVGVYVTAHPLLAFLHDDWRAYGWALAALAPLVAVAALDVVQHWPRGEEIDRQSLGYSNAVFVAVLVALLYVAGVQASIYKQTGVAAFQARDFEIAVWSVLSHVLLAILFVSVLNLIGKASSHAVRARSVGLTTIALLGFGSL